MQIQEVNHEINVTSKLAMQPEILLAECATEKPMKNAGVIQISSIHNKAAEKSSEERFFFPGTSENLYLV